MTEPSLLAAAIDINEPAFRKYLRGKAGVAFAQAAASIITDGSDDILIFRHDKAAGALHLIYVFRWGDRAEHIMRRPYFEALLGACAFMEEGQRGRVLISPGAMNFLVDGIEAAFVLEPGGSKRDDALGEAEMKRFDELLNKTLFDPKLAGLGYREAIRRPKFFDTKLRRKVDTLLEKHRQRVAIERLPLATALHPVRLCAHYHYNGHFMIYTEPGIVRPLPMLDPANFKQRDWGGSDARHTVIEGRVIATDPESFKGHSCDDEGTKFYTNSARVYWPSLDPIEGADPKTFKSAGHGFAYDSQRWYHYGGHVLSDVGANARIDDSLYYHYLTLLIGSSSVYMGAVRLPLDAASFSIKRMARSGPEGEPERAWFCDKDGDLIVSAQGWAQQLRIERTANAEQLWESLRSEPAEEQPISLAIRSLIEAMTPALDSADEKRAFVDFFEPWLEKNFETYQSEQPFDYNFWQAINNYFYCCWQLGEPAKILSLYPRIEARAWWNPYIFHHTACAFAKAGDLEASVREVYRALSYGYEKADVLLNDPDIAPLAVHEYFRQLKAHREQNMDQDRLFLPVAALRDPGRIPISAYSQLVSEIRRRFIVPDEKTISAVYAAHPAGEQDFRQALTAFIDGYARAIWRNRPHFSQFKEIYRPIGDVSGLSAIVHLMGAISLYCDGFFWADLQGDDSAARPEFAEAVQALQRMRASLAAAPAQLSDPVWHEIEEGDVTGPFIEMAEKLAPEMN